MKTTLLLNSLAQLGLPTGAEIARAGLTAALAVAACGVAVVMAAAAAAAAAIDAVASDWLAGCCAAATCAAKAFNVFWDACASLDALTSELADATLVLASRVLALA